jgi:hypothetical protein
LFGPPRPRTIFDADNGCSFTGSAYSRSPISSTPPHATVGEAAGWALTKLYARDRTKANPRSPVFLWVATSNQQAFVDDSVPEYTTKVASGEPTRTLLHAPNRDTIVAGPQRRRLERRAWTRGDGNDLDPRNAEEGWLAAADCGARCCKRSTAENASQAAVAVDDGRRHSRVPRSPVLLTSSHSVAARPRYPAASGTTLAATNKSIRRAASASGVTPCFLGEKRGFSPGPANGPPSTAVRS